MSHDETPSPRPPGRLYAVGIAMVLVMAAFSIATYLQRNRAIADERSARTREVDAGLAVQATKAILSTGPRLVKLPGDVRAFHQITLYAKVSGYLKDIHVDKGDRVKTGHVLGVVESPETDQQVLATEADLVQKRQLAERYRALVGKGVVSQQEMDRATADLQAATADLARLRALKDYEIIRAPFDGTITARYVDAGALLPAATGSTQTAQPLVDLADTSRLRVFVYVGQADAPYIREGDAVTIEGEDDENALHLSATITRITRALDPRTRTMLAEIDLDNRQDTLYPGLFVHVSLNVKAPPGLLIPADAIVVRGGKQQVAVITANRAHFQAVRVGDDDGHTVRILDGLHTGDVVGVHVGDEISEGATVQVVLQDSP